MKIYKLFNCSCARLEPILILLIVSFCFVDDLAYSQDAKKFLEKYKESESLRIGEIAALKVAKTPGEMVIILTSHKRPFSEQVQFDCAEKVIEAFELGTEPTVSQDAVILITARSLDYTWEKNLSERMEKRSEAIEELMASGIVGENNIGYLSTIAPHLSESQSTVIGAENEDRLLKYQHLADITGSSIEDVTCYSALERRHLAKVGWLYQTPEGVWTKKK